MSSTRPSDIRKRILKQRGVELKRLTRKPTHVSELPSPYHKTRLMQLVEHQQGQRLENIIYKGTIYDAGHKLGLHASTISKWRKLITEAFFEQFERS